MKKEREKRERERRERERGRRIEVEKKRNVALTERALKTPSQSFLSIYLLSFPISFFIHSLKAIISTAVVKLGAFSNCM